MFVDRKNIIKDIFAGVVVALVSIPIGLGYAQISGLPAVYGLYGSLLPIIVFGLITSSRQFVVGVDAMPAVMVGAMLTTLGIEGESETALSLVPVMTVLTAMWLFVFFIFKAGRIVKYISGPVMGGFISGVGVTIMIMQVPKLFGGGAGTGEIVLLVINIISESVNFNTVSFLLGIGTFAIIQISKKLFPKFPMSVVMLAAGVILTAVFHVEQYGVKTLQAVEPGLPQLIFPDIRVLGENASDVIVQCLMIAMVIMAQTLLASNSYASKYDVELDNNRELLGYSAANIAGALLGSCPINGSVSRTGIADQFGAKSQIMSITAGLVMMLVLLFGTGLLVYLPVPVLTAIVMAALYGILDIRMARRLYHENKNELLIFMAAFFGVLVFGTIYGVVIGVVLSFAEVIVRAVVPPKAFVGMIPGHDDLYSLSRNKSSKPIKGAVIYRFGGNLFFANIKNFEDDIMSSIKDDTICVIVDARGIGNIDITAADRLMYISSKLKKRGIKFYLTEHGGSINDELRRYGAGELISFGHVRRTVSLALRDAGIEKPYPLEGEEEGKEYSFVESSERLAEIHWAFGEDADNALHHIAREIADNLLSDENEDILEAEKHTSYGRIGLFDEEEMLDYLEGYLQHDFEEKTISEKEIKHIHEKIILRREEVEAKLKKLNARAYDRLKEKREKLWSKKSTDR